MDINYVYKITHEYLLDEKYYEVKHIGFISSKEVVGQTIDEMMNLPGFKDYPRDYFIVEKVCLNDFKKWKNGCTDDQLKLLL